MDSHVNQPLPWIALGLFAVSAALWRASRERARLRTAWGFLLLWAAIQISTVLPPGWLPGPAIVREVSIALIELAAFQIAIVLAFDFVLRRVHLPKFVSEIAIVAGYIGILFNLLYKEGVNVTGIFATSAVATAVVGLALQDMLGNIAGGIALELEGGVLVGDFIKCGDASGWVQHVRLRHTAIRTKDGDIVILPNSHLTRSPVHICAKLHRHFVPLQMPYTSNPQEVIDAVEFALRQSPPAGVAADPAPRCQIQEMTPGHIKYAAVVWLTRPGHESEAISAVNVRLYFALRRAGLPVSEITNLLEMKAGEAGSGEKLNPVDVLRRTPILRLLSDQDLFEIGSHLQQLSFATGEHIIRQGEDGPSMYFIVAGQVAIQYRAPDGAERRISVMEPGDFFGEASLLTGEIRTASAVAQSRVDCCRLTKEGLQGILARRPELAEDMSVVMAHRQMELALVRERLDMETARQREAENQTQLLARIRRFFAIHS
ncbi:MAG: mechanosensitive ion channel family protein [Acidobacteriota bacterium]